MTRGPRAALWISPGFPRVIVLRFLLSLTRYVARRAASAISIGAGKDTNMREIQIRSRYSEQTNEWSAEINGTFYESLTREELWELLRRATSDLQKKARRSQ